LFDKTQSRRVREGAKELLSGGAHGRKTRAQEKSANAAARAVQAAALRRRQAMAQPSLAERPVRIGGKRRDVVMQKCFIALSLGSTEHGRSERTVQK